MAVLLGASVLSFSAGRPVAATGGTTGDGSAPRIAVGGDVQSQDRGSVDGTGDVQFAQPEVTEAPLGDFAAIDIGADQVEPEVPVAVEGPFIDDGTLVKPIAVDTTVPDGSALVKTYTVKPGDNLAAIAAKFHVSTMSVAWANDLKSKTDIHTGQKLSIPPVTGLIVTVTPTDTLDSLAARYGVNGTDILATNGLDDPNLVVGQVLVVPGAKGAPMPTPKPATGTADLAAGDQQRATARDVPGRHVPVAGRRWRQLHQPVLPLRPLRHRHRRRLRLEGPRRGSRHRHLRGLEEQRRRVPGLDRARLRPVHDVQPHVGDLGRARPARQPRPAGRPGRPIRQRDGAALHFEVWIGPVWDGGRRVNPLGYL